jgi:predicted enzyme related to lactoylglutathione lyase
MSEKKKPSSATSGTPTPGTVDTKLEVVVIPVSDVDQAKAFYESLGWRLDVDRVDGEFRVLQFTPTGSSCSVQFGANLTPAEPGSTRALLLIVSDIDAAHDDLAARGVKVSDVFHCATGSVCRFRDASGTTARLDPRPIATATAPTSRSAIPTATAGCCKR